MKEKEIRLTINGKYRVKCKYSRTTGGSKSSRMHRWAYKLEGQTPTPGQPEIIVHYLLEKDISSPRYKRPSLDDDDDSIDLVTSRHQKLIAAGYPKRPLPAYAIFCREKKLPINLARQEWSKLSVDERNEYKNKAAPAWDKYRADVEEYNRKEEQARRDQGAMIRSDHVVVMSGQRKSRRPVGTWGESIDSIVSTSSDPRSCHAGPMPKDVVCLDLHDDERGFSPSTLYEADVEEGLCDGDPPDKSIQKLYNDRADALDRRLEMEEAKMMPANESENIHEDADYPEDMNVDDPTPADASAAAQESNEYWGAGKGDIDLDPSFYGQTSADLREIPEDLRDALRDHFGHDKYGLNRLARCFSSCDEDGNLLFFYLIRKDLRYSSIQDGKLLPLLEKRMQSKPHSKIMHDLKSAEKSSRLFPVLLSGDRAVLSTIEDVDVFQILPSAIGRLGIDLEDFNVLRALLNLRHYVEDTLDLDKSAGYNKRYLQYEQRGETERILVASRHSDAFALNFWSGKNQNTSCIMMFGAMILHGVSKTFGKKDKMTYLFRNGKTCSMTLKSKCLSYKIFGGLGSAIDGSKPLHYYYYSRNHEGVIFPPMVSDFICAF